MMPKSTAVDRYRRDFSLLQREAEAWDSIHAGVKAKVELLIDGQHYDDGDADEYEKRSGEVRWVDESAFHRWRHEVGTVTEAGTLTARPLDLQGDAELAEIAVRLVQSDTENPAKEFEDAWEDVVGCASAASYGVGWLDFLPNEGPWGEIIYAGDDPRNFMCDRRVKSVHNLRCRFVIRKFRLTKGEARRRVAKGDASGWDAKVVEKLRPDDGGSLATLRVMGETTQNPTASMHSKGTPLADPDDEEFTAYAIWYRSSDETDEVPADDGLEDDMRYMRCTSCGYRSETQGRLNAHADAPQELPDSLQNGCPDCLDSTDPTHHGDMVRVDREDKTTEMLAYPDGRLVILAPFALPGSEEYLYEGPWPFKLRSFPCAFLPRFRHPFNIIGPSIADLVWWNLIATDVMMRLALERMVQTAPFTLFPNDGLNDARGNRFEGSNENGWQAFYEGTSMPMVQVVGGDPGIPAAWSTIYQSARQALTGYTGLADVNIQQDQSRDIAASSLAMQVKQEEIPVAHFKRRYQRQRGLLIGVYFDMMRAVYPEERLYRLLGEDAADTVRALAASDLPNFDFFFDSTPDMRPQDEAQSRAADALANYIETRPWFVDVFAQVNHISPSLVRKAKQAFQQQQQAMAAQQQAAAQAQAPQPGAVAPQEPTSGMVERLLSGMGSQSNR